MVTRPRLWLKTTSEKGPHLSCVVFTKGRSTTRRLSRRQLEESPIGRTFEAKNGIGCHHGAVGSTNTLHTLLPTNREYSFQLKRWQVDGDGKSPVLNARVNVD